MHWVIYIITQGEPIRREPLEAMSKYVNVEDIRNLKFADLHNRIEIKNQKIFILWISRTMR